MKGLLIFILILDVVGVASAQNRSTYTAYSAWVHVNTKPVVSKRLFTSSKALVVIDDDFTKSSNPYGWRTSELGGTMYRRESGKYRITTPIETSDVATVIDAKCNLDSVDFELETIVASKGQTSPRAGLVWGYRDDKNYMSFEMNSKGEYAYVFITKGDNVEDSGFKLSPYVSMTSDNKLTVKKVSNKVFFYINGNNVYSGDYGNKRSNRIGLITSDKEVTFKRFVFRQITR